MAPAVQTTIDASHDRLIDQIDILDLTARFGILLDAREWDRLRRLFDDEVAVDYTSLTGEEPQTLPADQLVDGWRHSLSNLDATNHLIGNAVITIDGDRASCAASVQGTHVLENRTGGGTWTVGGRYDFSLVRLTDGWRIKGLTLTVHWASGNRDVMRLASETSDDG